MSTGAYNSTLPTWENGQQTTIQTDNRGRVLTTGQTAGTSADPTFQRSVGGSTIATNQAASSLSPAAGALIVAARSGRQSVVITNITGTQPVYLGGAGVTVANGAFLAGTVGASITIATAAAIYATAPTGAQTLSYLENY